MGRAMKTSLDHLPEKKQHQIRALGELILRKPQGCPRPRQLQCNVKPAAQPVKFTVMSVRPW